MSQKELDLLKLELAEFDEKTRGLLGLPITLKRWRERKIKAIEKEKMKIVQNYFKEPKK